MWSYHPTAVAPAMAIVLSRKPDHPGLMWVVPICWMLSLSLLAFDLARCLGVLLWMTFFLAAMLVWTFTVSQRKPAPVFVENAG
jgi:hypothetical protein